MDTAALTTMQESLAWTLGHIDLLTKYPLWILEMAKTFSEVPSSYKYSLLFPKGLQSKNGYIREPPPPQKHPR